MTAGASYDDPKFVDVKVRKNVPASPRSPPSARFERTISPYACLGAHMHVLILTHALVCTEFYPNGTRRLHHQASWLVRDKSAGGIATREGEEGREIISPACGASWRLHDQIAGGIGTH